MGRGFVPGGDPKGQGSRQMISQGGCGHCGVAPRPPAGQRGGRSPSARERAEVLQEAFALLSEDFPCGLGFPAPLEGFDVLCEKGTDKGRAFFSQTNSVRPWGWGRAGARGSAEPAGCEWPRSVPPCPPGGVASARSLCSHFNRRIPTWALPKAAAWLWGPLAGGHRHCPSVPLPSGRSRLQPTPAARPCSRGHESFGGIRCLPFCPPPPHLPLLQLACSTPQFLKRVTGEWWRSRRWLCGDELTGVFPSWIPAHGAVLGTGASPELCPDTTLGCCQHRAGAHTWGFGVVAGCTAGDCPKSLERAAMPWPERFPPTALKEKLLPWLVFPAPV